MAHKFSDLLQSIQNTQIRIALERMFSLVGVTATTKYGDDISGDLTGDVTGNLNGTTGAKWSIVTTDTTDGEDGTAAVQFVFQDADGVAVAAPMAGTFYLSEVATGLSRAPADTSIVALTNGAVQTIDAAVENGWHFVTSAAGLLGLTITAADDDYYVCFLHPDGGIVISDAITISSGG